MANFLIDHHPRRFSQPKRFKIKTFGRGDTEANSDDCSSVSSRRNLDNESDFYSGTRHSSADMARGQFHEFCEYIILFKFFCLSLNFYRLTEQHKQTIRVIRKIKFFVARRKFQVIYKLV